MPYLSTTIIFSFLRAKKIPSIFTTLYHYSSTSGRGTRLSEPRGHTCKTWHIISEQFAPSQFTFLFCVHTDNKLNTKWLRLVQGFTYLFLFLLLKKKKKKPRLDQNNYLSFYPPPPFFPSSLKVVKFTTKINRLLSYRSRPQHKDLWGLHHLSIGFHFSSCKVGWGGEGISRDHSLTACGTHTFWERGLTRPSYKIIFQ